MSKKRIKDENDFGKVARVKGRKPRAERDAEYSRRVEAFKGDIRRAIGDSDDRPILVDEWRRVHKVKGDSAAVDALDAMRPDILEYNARTSSDIPSTTKERTQGHIKQIQSEETARRKERGLEDARRLVDRGRRNRDQPAPDSRIGAKRRKRGGGGRQPWV